MKTPAELVDEVFALWRDEIPAWGEGRVVPNEDQFRQMAIEAVEEEILQREQEITREKITTAIVETLQNRVDGAGSDLEYVGELDGIWLFVTGNVDVQQLVSEVLHAIGQGEP